MKVSGIYKITSPSGKIYIGQTINWKKRLNAYKHLRCESQVRLYNSLKKYGFDKHIFEIIKECEPTQLNEFEIYYGELLNAKGGLNIRDFGSSGRHSIETCAKIGAIHRGKKISKEQKKTISLANKGKVVSLETRLKLSISSKAFCKEISKRNAGKGNFMYGKTHSEKTKGLIGEKSFGRKHSVESRENKSKIILNTQTGVFYFGIINAAKSTGINKSTLYAHLSGYVKNKTNFIYV